MRRIAGLLGLVVLTLVGATGAASAQEYPIDQPAQVQAYGAQRPGDSFNKEDCGFLGGSTAQIRVNDTAAGTKTVGSDGCVRMTVKIVDEDTISIDGTEYPALRCRSNVIYVTAPVPSGSAQSRQVQNRFTINCGAVAASNLPRTGSDIGSLVALGGVLVVVGTTVVLIVRRRRTLTDTATA